MFGVVSLFNFNHCHSVKVLLSCVQVFATPSDCSPQGSSVHGILQARILEWVVIPFSRGSSQYRDPTLKVSTQCRSPALQVNSLSSEHKCTVKSVVPLFWISLMTNYVEHLFVSIFLLLIFFGKVLKYFARF